MRKLVGIITLMTLIGCARQTAPTGGDVDKEPPFLVESAPANNSTNFKGQQIRFEFDNYIVLKDFKSQTVISPPLKHGFDQQPKGKGFILTFEDTLLPNTTYRIDFNNVITDLTEGNESSGLHTKTKYTDRKGNDSLVTVKGQAFVFSTGAQIDTLKLSGQVVLAEGGEGEAGLTVGLYKSIADSVVFKDRPLFVTRTGEEGYFQFKNLPQGQYQVAAFEDLNGDNKVNTTTERIGFKTELYAPSDSIGPILNLFKEDTKTQYVKSKEWQQPGKLVVTMNKPCQEIALSNFNVQMKKAWQLFERGANNDTIVMWATTTGLPDTLKFTVTADDFSEELSVVTTEDQRTAKKDKATKDTLLPLANHNLKANLIPDQPGRLVFKTPAMDHDQGKIQLLRDSVAQTCQLYTNDPAHRRYQLKTELKPGNYQLTLLPGAFKDIYDLGHDTMTFQFAVQAPDAYGTLDLNMSGTGWTVHQRVQINYAGGKQVLDVSTKERQVKTGLLEPGDYLIKATIDNNGDGVWTPGSVYHKIQPELVVQYPDTVKVEAGRQSEVSWERK